MKHLFTCAALLASTSTMALPLSHFDAESPQLDAFIDQTSEFSAVRSVSQSFVAGFDQLNFIELNLSALNHNTEQSLSLNIYDAAGQSIYSSTNSAGVKNCTTWNCTIGTGVNAAKRFTLSPSLSVTPNAKYTLTITSDGPLNLGYSNTDSYLDGEMMVDGAVVAGKDLWFKTGWERSNREEFFGDYHFTGVISDVVTLGHSSTPQEFNLGTAVDGVLAVAPEAVFAGAEFGLSAYIPKRSMRSEIRLLNDVNGGFEDGRDDNSLFIFSGGALGVANNFQDAVSSYDLYVTLSERLIFGSWLGGLKSSELRLVMKDESGQALSQNNYSHISLLPNSFDERFIVMTLIDESTINENGSETIDKGHIITIDINQMTDVGPELLSADFNVVTEQNSITLSNRHAEESAHQVEWFDFVFYEGSGTPFEMSFWEGSSHLIRSRVSSGPYAKHEVRTISASDDGRNRIHPVDFVQFYDRNGDGGVEEYIYQPEVIEIYRSDAGSAAAQFLIESQYFEGDGFLNLNILDQGAEDAGLEVWATYATEASNLEDTDEYSWYRLGEFSHADIAASGGNLLLDGSSLAMITSRRSKIIVMPIGGDEATPLKFSGNFEYAPLLTLEPTFPLSSSSSSFVSSSSSLAVSSVLSSSEGFSSSSAASVSSSTSSSVVTSLSSSSVASSTITVSSASSIAMSSIASSNDQLSSSSTSMTSSSVVSSSVPVLSSSSAVSSEITVSSSSASSETNRPAECEINVVSQWNTGLTAEVIIRNVSNETINGWSVAVSFLDGGTLNNLWNGNVTTNSGSLLQVENLSWNASIQPGQSINFGFVASKNGGAGSIGVSGDLCQ